MTGDVTPTMTPQPNAPLALYLRTVGCLQRCDRERGATMVEYGVLLMLVFLVAIVTLALFGESIVGLFESGEEAFENA